MHEIPVGPIHAGIIEPGHFRFSIVGEKVLRLEERLGYVHKGIDKRFEQFSVAEGFRLAGRVCGDSTVAFAWAYAQAAESLLGVVPTPRARWVRALALERERVANHLGDLGALGNDVALAFALSQFMRLKEDWLRLSGEVFGHRLLMDLVVPGGVAAGFTATQAERMVSQAHAIESEVLELRTIFDEHAGLQDRFLTTGRVTPELARKLGLTGLAGRASGQQSDLRADFPTAPYGELAVRKAGQAAGDVAARAYVRFDELLESLRLTRRHRHGGPRWRIAGGPPGAQGRRLRRGLGRGLARRGSRRTRGGRGRADPPLPRARSLVAELAAHRARGDRQHRSRLPAHQQELQPELFRAGLLMIRILHKIVRTGIVSEDAPDPREELRTRAPEIQAEVLRLLGRALAIRQVDAGSCNGCELEIHALNNPYYNLEGLGMRFVASPRHADMLLVTGPVAKNMEHALRIAYEATPEPEAGRRGRRLRVQRRDLRRELCELRESGERDPGRCRRAGLPAAAARDPGGHPHGRHGAHKRSLRQLDMDKKPFYVTTGKLLSIVGFVCAFAFMAIIARPKPEPPAKPSEQAQVPKESFSADQFERDMRAREVEVRGEVAKNKEASDAEARRLAEEGGTWVIVDGSWQRTHNPPTDPKE